jgi:tetratricopeptide (TPR) repeat protein
MPRPFALVSILLVIPFLLAAEPTPVEKQLSIQKAMLSARQYLDVNKPAEAVAALEAEIANADGNKVFLALLRESYLAELTRLEKAPTPDAVRVAQLRRHLALLGGAAPVATAPVASPVVKPTLPPPALDPPAMTPVATPPAPSADSLAEASAEFKKGNYAAAAKFFASNASILSADQKAAWAYCRVKIASDEVNSKACDAELVIAEVTDALKLIPQNAEFQRIGQQVIATARSKANGRREPTGTSTGDAVETASFRVRHSNNRDLAENVAKAAESLRKEIFERWSGPPSGAWSVKCEIVIHSNAESFAKATGRPAGSTGNAVVRLTGGRAEERCIDLRADDAAIASNALPRELTHVVLADLFPDKPAPKWAVEGMAILAGSPEETGRYTRTLQRCARDGEWLALAQLMEMKDFPADKITAFYCESVALTEYLVRAAGSERNFTIFVRDCQRYGTAQALKRQFNIDGLQALEAGWKRSALEQSR